MLGHFWTKMAQFLTDRLFISTNPMSVSINFCISYVNSSGYFENEYLNNANFHM